MAYAILRFAKHKGGASKALQPYMGGKDRLVPRH